MLDSQIIAQVRTLVNNTDADLELNAHEVAIYYSQGLISAIRVYRDRLQAAHRKDKSVYVPSLSESKKRVEALPAPANQSDLKNLLAGKYELVNLPICKVKELVAGGPMEDAVLAYLYKNRI